METHIYTYKSTYIKIYIYLYRKIYISKYTYIFSIWDWSFKVGGKIEFQMEKEKPGFKNGPKLIDLVEGDQKQKEKDGDQKFEEVKNLNLNLAENGKEAPRPPMYHHITAR